jgi:hypothetical protein
VKDKFSSFFIKYKFSSHQLEFIGLIGLVCDDSKIFSSCLTGRSLSSSGAQ